MLVDVFTVINTKVGTMRKLVVCEPGTLALEDNEDTTVIKMGTANIASLHLHTSKQSALTFVDRSGQFTGFTPCKVGGAWTLEEATILFNNNYATVHCVDLGRSRLREVHSLVEAVDFYND